MGTRLQASIVAVVFILLASGLAAVSCGGGDDESDVDRVKLNELQFIGTHNSYHVQPPKAVLDAIASFRADFAAGAEFSHLPLKDQLQAGVRQVELDAYYDPQGGRYVKRVGAELLGIDATSGAAELKAPGFKVMHSPEIDFYSTCWTLKSCLSEIAAWSNANRDHLPITVWVEPKDQPTEDPLNLGFVQPLPVDATALRALEEEILGVFAQDRLITPDAVRGSKKTLEEAVLDDGWPNLEKARGKVMFVLLDETTKRAAYLEGASSLEGRVMFTTSSAGRPDAAVILIDDPEASGQTITQLVRSGYLVRTRADSDSIEPRVNDTSRREAAFASGATWVSTDYPESKGVAAGGYVVRFADGGFVRCNPLTASAKCTSAIGALVRK